MKTNKWKVSVEVEVSFDWIDDGFDMQERTQEIQDAFQNMLPYAYEHEMKINVEVKDLKPSKAFHEAYNRSLD